MSVANHYFDELFRDSDDPWAFRERWYERRKRALTLAALPRERYESVFEPGCANGELSAELANRCERLLCCDTSARAVELARLRLAGLNHVEVLHARLPAQWPEGRFDLIVLSEMGYYLDSDDLDLWIQRAVESLTFNGHLLACHWRPHIQGCSLSAERVHRTLSTSLPMQKLFTHHEPDFLLDLWSRDGTSVAEQEDMLERPALLL